MHTGDGIDKRTLVLCCGDAIQFGFERPQAFGIHCLLVHACAVVVANFLVDSVSARTARGSFFQNVSQDELVSFLDFHKARPFRLVRRDLCFLQPVSAGVLVEINTRIGRLVDVVDAETHGRLPGGRSLSEGNDGEQ